MAIRVRPTSAQGAPNLYRAVMTLGKALMLAACCTTSLIAQGKIPAATEPEDALRGIRAVRVFLLGDREILDVNAIRNQIELKLRQSGFTVADTADA